MKKRDAKEAVPLPLPRFSRKQSVYEYPLTHYETIEASQILLRVGDPRLLVRVKTRDLHSVSATGFLVRSSNSNILSYTS